MTRDECIEAMARGMTPEFWTPRAVNEQRFDAAREVILEQATGAYEAMQPHIQAREEVVAGLATARSQFDSVGRIAELEADNARMRSSLRTIAREMADVSPEFVNLQIACDTAASFARAALGDA